MTSETNFPLPNDEEMEVRLWAYIDGVSEENGLIERLIAENAAWKAKYQSLLEVHGLLAGLELEQPSLRFTKDVMEAISRNQIAPAAREYINRKVVWGLAAFFLTMIVGFLVYGFAQIDWSAAGSASIPVGIDLSAVDYSGFFNNGFVNAFTGLNVILGLLLLDRYLNFKRKKAINS